MTTRLTVISNQTSPAAPHFIDGVVCSPTSTFGASTFVQNPATGEKLLSVYEATDSEISRALHSAEESQKGWAAWPVKQRSNVLFAFRQQLLEHQRWFVETITREHGKHETDALASFLKGVETLDYALGLPAITAGRVLEVSSGVTCQERREAVGVVLSIVPFNFPVMVPMWTLPIGLMLGNAMVMKPSEKVPSCLVKIGELLKIAGLPDGVYSVLQGGSSLVTKLINHPTITAVTFVGSTPIAKKVYDLSSAADAKRALCLGGAKNHLVACADCDIEMTAADVVASFAGSSGQRCMAASVLLVVGSHKNLATHPLVEKIVQKAQQLLPGQSGPSRMGPVIDEVALRRINNFVTSSEEKFSAKILLDGRRWMETEKRGFWFGPTVMVHERIDDPALVEEIFGPVLSIIQVPSIDEAVARINGHPYGNAACIYTANGGIAEAFSKAVNVGIVGVNIGVPVPREPFSFGGSKLSKFGVTDITGDGLVEFLTRRVKVTTKWSAKKLNGHSRDVVAEAFVKLSVCSSLQH